MFSRRCSPERKVITLAEEEENAVGDPIIEPARLRCPAQSHTSFVFPAHAMPNQRIRDLLLARGAARSSQKVVVPIARIPHFVVCHIIVAHRI